MSELFLNQLRKIILENIEDENFGVEELAKAVGYSRYQLYRKIKESTEKSVSRFILEVRLGKAHELLQQGDLSVSEIGYAVGFSSPSYFNKSFKAFYGYAPGELKRKKDFQETSAEILSESENSDKKLIILKQESEPHSKHTESKIFVRNYITARSLTVLLAALTLITAALFIQNRFFNKNSEANSGVKNLNILLPKEYPISFINSAQGIAGHTAFDISDDGKQFVYASDVNGTIKLALRQLDKEDVQILEGTEGAFDPFFSPDGKWVAYFTLNEEFHASLYKVSLEKGLTVKLCNASTPFGGDWGENGKIVFADSQGTIIRMIDENGGITEDLIIKDDYNFSGWITFPKFLPGNEKLIGSGSPIRIIDLKNKKVTLLNENGYNVQYAESGHLLFVKDAKLFASPFDIKNEKLSETSIPFFSGIRTEPTKNPAQFSISKNGILVYAKGENTSLCRFVWVNRKGEVTDTLDLPADNYGTFSISGSGNVLTYQLENNVWYYHLHNKNKIKIPESNRARFPFANFDGSCVAYSSSKNDSSEINVFCTNSSAGIRELRISDNGFVLNDWSPDDNYIGFHRKQDIYVYSLAEDSIYTLLNNNYWESQMDFSHDSKYFTYMTEENGYMEIFVQPFPVTGEKWNVSKGRGGDPIWSSDGKEIFFRIKNEYFSVKVNRDSVISFESPSLLFTNNRFYDAPLKSFAVSPDRQKLLLLQFENTVNQSRELTILENWFIEL